jgi:hypothetical protein
MNTAATSMSFSEGHLALVQSRLSVLASVLSLLIFVTVAVLALARIPGNERDMSWIYLSSLVPICVGFLLALFGMGCFLRSQHFISQTWFTVGQLMLYLALSQFLASGMSNFISAMAGGFELHWGMHSTASRFLIWSLVILSEVLWLYLLLVAPLAYLHGSTQIVVLAAKQRIILRSVFWSLLVAVLLLDAMPYYIRAGGTGTWELLWQVVCQLGQPFLWARQGV